MIILKNFIDSTIQMPLTSIIFQIFYWTHLLYIFYWGLLIIHGPAFWKWFIVPAIIFGVEKTHRVTKSLSNEGKSWVTTGIVLPSKVVSLVIKRPPHFAFKPGDYIFVNIPAIATFEWHPFTISSAPEQSDAISLHIRVVGHWTRKLYEYFEAEQKRLQCTMDGGKRKMRPKIVINKISQKNQLLKLSLVNNVLPFCRCLC